MQMANPAFEEAGRPGTVTNRLLPVYPLTAGLSNRTLCACIRQAFSAAARCRSFCRRRCGSSTACAA